MNPADKLLAIETIRKSLPGAGAARVLVIAGSGLGGFVKSVQADREISYAQIPGVSGSTVVGHAGKLIFGRTGNNEVPVVVMAGRRHLYEGMPTAQVVQLPELILEALPSIRYIIVSNAAGGLNPKFAVGDLMIISDHINWMFRNFSPRQCPAKFPPHSTIYDEELRTLALATGLDAGIALKQGVYIGMSGPNYETRAEIAMARHLLGADAVGMSTVPEGILAASAGRKVLGISFISNMLVEAVATTHEEVMANAVIVEKRFSTLILALLEKLHHAL